jgi:hypothetical protein
MDEPPASDFNLPCDGRGGLSAFKREGKKLGHWMGQSAVAITEDAKARGLPLDQVGDMITQALAADLNANLDEIRSRTKASEAQIEAFRRAVIKEHNRILEAQVQMRRNSG